MLPLIVRQAASIAAMGFLREDGDATVWWGTRVECAVALSRLVREGELNEETEEEARARLDLLSDNWSEIQPDDEVRSLAVLLSRRHPLKVADALQLAAALQWCEGDAAGKDFVCFDDRLRRAAQREGFRILAELTEEGAEEQ